MSKKRMLLPTIMVGVLSLLSAKFASAEMLNTPEENASWLKKGIAKVEEALTAAQQGDGKKSKSTAQEGLEAMKEINSEGWAPKLQRAKTSIRYGMKAAERGEFEKAATEYKDALAKFKDIKIGDMTYTHDSFF